MATTGTRSTKADVQAKEPDLEADIRQLREDIMQLTQHLKQTGNRSVSRAQRVAKESVDQLKGTAHDLEGELVESVREKPLTAVALAAGAGFFLAMIMRR